MSLGRVRGVGATGDLVGCRGASWRACFVIRDPLGLPLVCTLWVAQVLVHGGVAGLHVMPIGKASKGLALRMLAVCSLPPSAAA